MIRRVLPLVAMAALFLCRAEASDARSEKGALFVNEVPVLSFRAAGAASRAASAATRLRSVGGSEAVSVRALRRKAQIKVGTRVVLEVSRAEAQAHGASIVALAESWASTLRKALALPPLQFASTDIRMRTSSANSIGLIGSEARKCALSSTDAKVVRASKALGRVRLDAHSAGTANVIARSGKNEIMLRVLVQPPSARLPQSVSAEVCGLPASSWTVQGAAEGAVMTRLVTVEGASIEVKPIAAKPLEAGRSVNYQARVSVESPNAFPVQGTVSVTVRNSPLSGIPDAELWYSNDPENVKSVGPLFSANLAPNRPTRLFYHHINAAPQGMVIAVEVANTSSRTAKVQLIPGDGEPSSNPVLAGVVAGERFLRNWMQRSGEIISIPPRSSIPISMRRLGPQETSSGICVIRLLTGGPDAVGVRVEARPTYAPNERWALAQTVSSPWRVLGAIPLRDSYEASVNGSIHAYPDPSKREEVEYEVGGKHGFVRIGQQPIARSDGQGSLQGNFGVFYWIRAVLSNPTQGAADVEIVFEASAGYSGAVFVLNGEVVRSPMLQPKDGVRLLRVRLEPGARREVSILTMPLGGGSYPATLSVRQVDGASLPGTIKTIQSEIYDP